MAVDGRRLAGHSESDHETTQETPETRLGEAAQGTSVGRQARAALRSFR
jgi:hypothetical protein